MLDSRIRTTIGVKSTQRLDYNRLVELLRERELVDPPVLQTILQSAAEAAIPFPELLLMQEILSDWELSRLVCEHYGLPFLPVELYPPTQEALELVEPDFVRVHRLIPIALHDQTLTVCMPGLVPADVLGLLAAQTDMQVLPFVGSVHSNARWILENLPEETPPSLMNGSNDFAAVETGTFEPAPAMPQSGPEAAGVTEDWDNFFDEADAAVLMDLSPEPTDDDGAALPDLPQIPEPPPAE